MTRELTIGLAQVKGCRTKEHSLKKAVKTAEKMRDADIIVYPEYLMFDPTGVPGRLYLFSAETLDGPWVHTFSKMAREKSVYILTTMFEKIMDNRRVYNTAVLINDVGEVIGAYRKTHLFDAYDYRESRVIKQGNELSGIYDVRGIKIGLAMCFELRFPEVFRASALRGAEAILVPMAWYKGHLKEEMLKTMIQARAHENTVYIATSSLVGENFVGRSMIAHPYGHVLIDAGPWENYVEQKISTEEIMEVRKALPLLQLRRRELYKKTCEQE